MVQVQVVDVIHQFNGNLHYPTLESEYFLVSTIEYLFTTRLYLDLTKQDMADLEHLGHHCQNYTTMASVDLLRAYDDFERISSEYQNKREKCALFKKACPTECVSLPHLASFVLLQDCFTSFLDDEIKQIKELLLTTIKSHSEESTEDSVNNWERQLSKIQLRAREDPNFIGVIRCSFWNQTENLHYTYFRYKQYLGLVLKDLSQVKSVISRTLPHFLGKMDTALRNFETLLSCDWRAVSAKYVQLEFYLRNTWYIWTFHQTSLPLVTSEFLSRRIKNVLLQPSNELLEHTLRLASEQQRDSFKYLESLIIEKPPLWENIDKEVYE